MTHSVTRIEEEEEEEEEFKEAESFPTILVKQLK